MTEPLTSDGRVATRGAVQRRAEELIRQGYRNSEAARICRVELGGRTTPACIAWYRNRIRKQQLRTQELRTKPQFAGCPLWG